MLLKLTKKQIKPILILKIYYYEQDYRFIDGDLYDGFLC